MNQYNAAAAVRQHASMPVPYETLIKYLPAEVVLDVVEADQATNRTEELEDLALWLEKQR